MESKAKLLGHPIHPMLVVFPLGLLVIACVFDGIALGTGNHFFYSVSYWNIVAGVISGPIAALFGWIDWFAIPRNTRARDIGLWHGMGNMLVVALFAVSWWLRYNNAAYVPDSVALGLSFGGIALGVITGWLGGELVDRLGVGVDRGAHLNAPNSLSGRPAREETSVRLDTEDLEERRAA